MEIQTLLENKTFVVKKLRCIYPDCNFHVMKLIGECSSCQNYYCHLHRYPETHQCQYLEEIKNKAIMTLSNKLMSEKIKIKKV